MAAEHASDGQGQGQGSSRRMSHSDTIRGHGEPQIEAGPSRARRSSSTQTPHAAKHIDGEEDKTMAAPSSPSSALSPRKSVPPIPHLDLATYPTQKLLRLLASLLQHIASANDQLRPDLEADMEDDGEPSSSGDSIARTRSRSHSRTSTTSNHTNTITHAGPSPTTALFTDSQGPGPPTSSRSHSRSNSNSRSHLSSQPAPSSPSIPAPIWPSEFPLFTASKNSLSHPSSLLAFHARHIPSISIEAYLLRILKYCPTTNEVFLGLLVYFDRMTRLGTPAGVGGENAGVAKGRGFAIDSYNVHRLVIAGVTVASKFFSDVFYTNSRYAKVGGLPPHELNQLELQFLLLNDFRLRISVEEMQRYGDRLLAYGEDEQDEPTILPKKDTQREERRMEKENEKRVRPAPVRQPTEQVVATVTAAGDESAEIQGQGPSEEDANQAMASYTASTPGTSAEQQDTGMDVDTSGQKPIAPDHPSAPNTEPSSRRASHSDSSGNAATSSSSTATPAPTAPSKSQTYPPPSAPTTSTNINEPHSSAAAALAAIRAQDREQPQSQSKSGIDDESAVQGNGMPEILVQQRERVV